MKKFTEDNPIPPYLYTIIMKAEDEEEIVDNVSTSSLWTLLTTGSGVRCNVCRIIRTTLETLKSHDSSRRHLIMCSQAKISTQ